MSETIKRVGAQLDTHPRGHLATRDICQRKGAPTRYRAQIKDLAVGDTLAGFGKVLEFAEVAPEGAWRVFRMVTEHPQTYPVRTNVFVRPAYVYFGVIALADGSE